MHDHHEGQATRGEDKLRLALVRHHRRTIDQQVRALVASGRRRSGHPRRRSTRSKSRAATRRRARCREPVAARLACRSRLRTPTGRRRRAEPSPHLRVGRPGQGGRRAIPPARAAPSRSAGSDQAGRPREVRRPASSSRGNHSIGTSHDAKSSLWTTWTAPNAAASRRANVDLPAPPGPSMATNRTGPQDGGNAEIRLAKSTYGHDKRGRRRAHERRTLAGW